LTGTNILRLDILTSVFDGVLAVEADEQLLEEWCWHRVGIASELKVKPRLHARPWHGDVDQRNVSNAVT